MVYGGRGGNDAHSAFSVSRSTSTTKMPDKLQLDKLSLEDCNEINEEPSVDEMKAELTNCIYLQDSSIEIYGLKIYGTPWQPEFCGWAFNLPRGQVENVVFLKKNLTRNPYVLDYLDCFFTWFKNCIAVA